MNPIDKIKSVAKSGILTYTAVFFGKQSIAIEVFEKKYELLQATNTEEGQTYYFRNVDVPNLIMRVNVVNDDVTLKLESIGYFKTEMKLMLP